MFVYTLLLPIIVFYIPLLYCYEYLTVTTLWSADELTFESLLSLYSWFVLWTAWAINTTCLRLTKDCVKLRLCNVER